MSEAPRRPATAGLVIAALLAGLGALILWDVARLPAGGGYSGVGPGGVPRVVGLALIGLAVWTALSARSVPAPLPERRALPPVLWIIGGLAAQLVLLGPLGFSAATALLFAATAHAFGERRLWLSLPAGFVLCMAVYFLFDRLLDLNLPGGMPEHLVFGG